MTGYYFPKKWLKTQGILIIHTNTNRIRTHPCIGVVVVADVFVIIGGVDCGGGGFGGGGDGDGGGGGSDGSGGGGGS